MKVPVTLARMTRDPWSYVGAALVVGAGFLFVSCSTPSVEFKLGSGSVTEPDLLKGAAEAVAEIPGMGWLKPVIAVVAAVTGSGILTKRAIKAHDDAPYTAEDVASIEAAKAGKPQA